MATLLKWISKSLNISYTLRPPIEDQSGILKDGKWTGMIGMLINENLDLSLTPLLITDDRFDAVPFSTPVFIGNIKILVGRPTAITSLPNLLATFQYKVWFFFAVSFIVLVFLIFVTERVLARSKNYSPQSIVDEIWIMVSWFLNRGYPENTFCLTFRMIFVLYAVTNLIISSLYAGGIHSFLAVLKYPDSIQSIADFPRFPNVQPLLHYGSSEVEYFRSSKTNPRKEIWDRVHRNPSSLMSHSDLYSDKTLDQVESGKSAIFQEWHLFQLHVSERQRQKISCRFRICPPYRIIPVGMGFHPNISAKFIEDINVRIQRMTEANLIEYLYPPKSSDYVKCLKDIGRNDVTAMTIFDVQAVFYLLLMGLLISLMTFGAEMLVASVCKLYKTVQDRRHIGRYRRSRLTRRRTRFKHYIEILIY